MRTFVLLCLVAVAWCQEVFEAPKETIVVQETPAVVVVDNQAIETLETVPQNIAAQETQSATVKNTTQSATDSSQSCGCSAGREIPLPRVAEAVLNSILSDLTTDAHKNVSAYFAYGVVPAFFAETFSHVDQAVFKVPDYILSSQNSVVAKVAWSYTLQENGQEYDDGLLLIVLKTDPITNLVTEFRAVHENEYFLNRLPKPLPVTVHELAQNFLNGINSLSQRDSLSYVRNNFVLTFRGQTSLLPLDFDTTVTLATFSKFQESFREVFGATRKSLSCLLVEEIGNTAVFDCSLHSKYAKVRTCLDLLITAESEEGLLKTMDIYVDGTCQSEKKLEIEQLHHKIKKEEDKRIKEEQRRVHDEEKRLKDEESRRVKEETRRTKEELKRQKEEAARRQLQQEEEAKRVKEEEAKRVREEEAKKLQEEAAKRAQVEEELTKSKKDEKKKSKQSKESKRK